MDTGHDGSRRNGASAREGIDTSIYRLVTPYIFISVEMEHQPERALILAIKASFDVEILCRNGASAREGIDTILLLKF